MNYAIFMEKLQALPADKQREVVDFVDFLAHRSGEDAVSTRAEWTEEDFASMGVEQAMRGLADEPDLYSSADLKERWP